MYTVTIRNMTHVNSETACADLTASQIQPTACHTAHERLPKQMSELFGYPAINGSHNPEFLIRIYIIYDAAMLLHWHDKMYEISQIIELPEIRIEVTEPMFWFMFFSSKSLVTFRPMVENTLAFHEKSIFFQSVKKSDQTIVSTFQNIQKHCLTPKTRKMGAF